ncbi:hypothetical protein K1719_016575 [Acacia pycnantha]|nr:hypothetical protein K1719_016575 [Acacia pycnantha]
MQRAEPPSPRRWRAQNEDLWQHVIRWRAQNDGYSSLVSSQQESLKREYEFMNHGEEPPLRKQRLVWTEELDSLFVEVVNYLGKKDAVPKRILEEMKKHRPELSLTRGQVGSHLQKHWVKEKKKQLPQPRMNIANGWNVMTVNQIPPRFDFHLPENSTINSLPHPPLSQMQNPHYDQQRIFCPPQIQPEHHEQHLACPPKQFNNFAVTSLIENGSSNLIPQHQPDFQVNTNRPAMHQPDRITSSKSNMLQQRQPQGPSSEGMESDMLQQQHFANGTSFGRSNMQQPHQNHALGTTFENSNMEQQMMTQNLTSSTQQLDHSSSAVFAPIRSGHDGMITPEATRVDECADLFNQQLEVDVQQSSGARDIFPNHGGFLDPFEGIDDPFQSIKHPFQEMYEMAGAMTASRSINDSFL